MNAKLIDAIEILIKHIQEHQEYKDENMIKWLAKIKTDEELKHMMERLDPETIEKEKRSEIENQIKPLKAWFDAQQKYQQDIREAQDRERYKAMEVEKYKYELEMAKRSMENKYAVAKQKIKEDSDRIGLWQMIKNIKNGIYDI